MRRFPGWLVLLLFLLTGLPCGSETISLGTHYGYVRLDRWGQRVLQAGTFATFFSESVFRKLESRMDQPLAVQVTDLYVPMNPGSGRIEEIGSVEIEPPEHDIALELQADRTPIRTGEGLSLTVTVRNLSDLELWWPLESLWVVFTRGYGTDLFEATTSENLWPYRWGFSSFLDPLEESLFLGTREVPLEWSEVSYQGPDPRGSTWISPGSILEGEALVATELPPGEYEVFVYWKTGNHQPPGAMSNVLAFDVEP